MSTPSRHETSQCDGREFPYFSEANSVEAVNARMGDEINPRLRKVMISLIKHLHGFIKDVQLTQAEWEAGIDFLTKAGQICSAERQEFILLSDTLGVSMLVDAINNRRPPGATENTVFGPFHVDGAPERQMGENICLDGKGESCRFEGTVKDIMTGKPISGVKIDVWSDNSEGYYDVQQPDVQPKWNNRGIFHTGEDGRYWFYGIKPVAYPIPNDGPVGKMLDHLGRHPWRPAHTHYLLTAPGYQKLVTHTFCANDDYLRSDTVFGVKDTLIAPFERVGDGRCEWHSVFDFFLVPNGEMPG